MDDPNAYENLFDGRHVTEETGKAVAAVEDKAKRESRCAQRPAERPVCRCGKAKRASRPNRNNKKILSQNPFIIFYLEMYYKNPKKRITDVAKQAGREWCAMAEEDRQKYVRLAERVRRRRARTGGRRRKR